MSERLTDEQVAELATCDAYIHPDDLMALAAEVQQSRQRRCENCRFYDVDVMGDGYCTNVDSRASHQGVTPDYFCADFTPQEAE
jgi:hypothetical protein